MGRLFIPETVFMHRVLPLERLLQGLAETLKDSEVGSTETGCRQQCDKVCCCMPRQARTGCPGFKPWFYSTVNIGHYRPADVSVKVENGHVIIHARREERNGDDYDISETKRIVKLPEVIDEKKVLCFLRPDGRVLIKAPPAGAAGTNESSKASAKSGEAIKDDTLDGGTNPSVDISDPDAGKTVNPETLVVSLTGEIPIEKDTDPEAIETAKKLLAAKENVDESLNVDADNDVAFVEPYIDVQMPDDVAETRHQPSPVPSDDFSIIDESSINTVNDFQQDTEAAQTDKNDEPDEDVFHANQDLYDKQWLKPLSDSVRVVEDGNRKKFEVSLNLKDFDAENMSVRLVDSELFVDAKKEVRENGVYSLQEVHRKYPVPEAGILDSAQAQITSDGLVTVTVSLEADQKDEPRTVPIVQLE